MRLIFIFLSIFAFANAKHCTFIPPSGWEIAQLKNPSSHVKIGFIGKGTGEFRPSVNLATEDVDVSLKEYVKAVKELQQTDPTTKWRDLGKISMQSGVGRLTEMSNPSPWGELKVLQAFFVADEKAYILTAAVLKADFPKFQSELLKTFQSLRLSEEIWTPIENSEKRAEFENLFATLGSSAEKDLEWEKLQEQVGFQAELGPYWQYIALKEGHAKIYSSN